jgi:hypothetical protein
LTESYRISTTLDREMAMDAIVRDLKVPARNLRHVSSLVIVASIWSMCASPAEAACDVPGPVCQTYWTYDAVFDGTVLSIERTDSDSEFAIKVGGGDRLVTFEIHRAWKGIDGKQAQLVLAGGFGSYVVSETLDVSVGERDVIFASRDRKGRLTSGGCGQSGRYAHATEALAYLNSLDRPPAGGRVFGTVRLSYRQLEKRPTFSSTSR